MGALEAVYNLLPSALTNCDKNISKRSCFIRAMITTQRRVAMRKQQTIRDLIVLSLELKYSRHDVS